MHGLSLADDPAALTDPTPAKILQSAYLSGCARSRHQRSALGADGRAELPLTSPALAAHSPVPWRQCPWTRAGPLLEQWSQSVAILCAKPRVITAFNGDSRSVSGQPRAEQDEDYPSRPHPAAHCDEG